MIPWLSRCHAIVPSPVFPRFESYRRIILHVSEVPTFYVVRYTEVLFAGKAYLRRHGHTIREEEDPINALLESTACITAEMAKGWFRHAGYIW